MLKSEFLEQVTDIDDLINYCSDNNIDTPYSFYSSDDRDTAIEEEAAEQIRYNGWYDCRDYLNTLESSGNYDWWFVSDYSTDWVGIAPYDADRIISEFADDLEAQGVLENPEEDEETDDDCSASVEPEEDLTPGSLAGVVSSTTYEFPQVPNLPPEPEPEPEEQSLESAEDALRLIRENLEARKKLEEQAFLEAKAKLNALFREEE